LIGVLIFRLSTGVEPEKRLNVDGALHCAGDVSDF